MIQTRRAFLGSLSAAGISLSGCSSASGDRNEADVIAGPGSRLTFEPQELTIKTGQAVTWYFESSGHNVSAIPDHSDIVSIPEEAEPFSSYETAKHRTMSRGETFSQRFRVAGTYEYVCIPHASAGMVGTIEVVA